MQQVTPDLRIRIKIYDRRMHHAAEYGRVRSSFEVDSPSRFMRSIVLRR